MSTRALTLASRVPVASMRRSTRAATPGRRGAARTREPASARAGTERGTWGTGRRPWSAGRWGGRGEPGGEIGDGGLRVVGELQRAREEADRRLELARPHLVQRRAREEARGAIAIAGLVEVVADALGLIDALLA